MNIEVIKNQFLCGAYDARLSDIYVAEEKTEYQRQRYIKAIEIFEQYYGQGEIMVFSAPGRSELGGNHTDHQNGRVLAASVNVDTIGIVRPTEGEVIQVISEGFQEITVSLADLELRREEKETTTALVKGVLAGIKKRGYRLGGFCAYITSDVLIGAGLSSSAAYETLIGTILSGLYNEMRIPPAEIAWIGQYAENVYFGKPCGLMDQMACSVGGVVYVDFANPDETIVEKIELDLDSYGYNLCITDTKGSHADLTADYAAIPAEMKAVAACFGQNTLRGITREELLKKITSLRTRVGDRGVLRALHFIEENERVAEEVNALKNQEIEEFLRLVQKSGNSSYQYLQNVYSNHDVQHQNLSVALALSELVLGENGVSRVHGGGFAGTIQAFVKKQETESYQKHMNAVFGTGACTVLKIRSCGGIRML